MYNPYFLNTPQGTPDDKMKYLMMQYFQPNVGDYNARLNAKLRNYQPSPLNQPTQAGADRGQMTSNITGAAISGLQMFNQWSSMADEAKAINTNTPAAMYDAQGNPDYNLGNFAAETNAIKPQGATGGEVLSSVGQGAAAGAAFGPIGAVVGGAVGAIGSLIGGGRRKRKMLEAKRRAKRRLYNAQENYNEAVVSSANQRKSQQAYVDSLDTSARMANLFNIQPRIV